MYLQAALSDLPTVRKFQEAAALSALDELRERQVLHIAATCKHVIMGSQAPGAGREPREGAAVGGEGARASPPARAAPARAESPGVRCKMMSVGGKELTCLPGRS
eukprot:766991-Hanusia_phi.AAC.18